MASSSSFMRAINMAAMERARAQPRITQPSMDPVTGAVPFTAGPMFAGVAPELPGGVFNIPRPGARQRLEDIDVPLLERELPREQTTFEAIIAALGHMAGAARNMDYVRRTLGTIAGAVTGGMGYVRNVLGQVGIPESVIAAATGASAALPSAGAAAPFAAAGLGVAAAGAGAFGLYKLYEWLQDPASEVPEDIRVQAIGSIDDLGGEGALGSGLSSIIGEMFVDPPEINYEGLPQQTYSTGFPAHRGMRGVGSGAMQHKTGGDLVFVQGARKSMAVMPYSAEATMEKLNKRTTTPDVAAH